MPQIHPAKVRVLTNLYLVKVFREDTNHCVGHCGADSSSLRATDPQSPAGCEASYYSGDGGSVARHDVD